MSKAESLDLRKVYSDLIRVQILLGLLILVVLGTITLGGLFR